MSDAKRIKELLHERVAEVAQYLFPNGHREGNNWRVGSIEGEPGKSFKICIAGPKAGMWGDFAESEKHSRNLLDLWMRARNVDFKTALRQAVEWLGCSFQRSKGTALSSGSVVARTVEQPTQVKPTDSPTTAKPFDWQSCVDAFEDRDALTLALWRRHKAGLYRWLKQNGLIGLYDGCIAFPVHDRKDNVVGCHYRLQNGSWLYHPKGATVRPLVIGEVIAGDPVHAFESYFDAFSFMHLSGERTGIIITRGAGNGKLLAGLISTRATVYAWKQNDEVNLQNGKRAGDEWLKDVAKNADAKVVWAKTPEQFKDLNDWTRADATSDDLFAAMVNAEVVSEKPPPLIEFRSPLQLKNFAPPPGIVLVGDRHIAKGSPFVIAGAPGVGKSRAATALAVAGATECDWFGLTVHRRFRTMIVQTENGEFRLSTEFAELDCDALEDYVRICPPPPFGMCFQRNEFRAQLEAQIKQFKPDIVIFDPWNAAARDEKARDYLDTFDALRSVLPFGNDAPALGIVAHTRKPKTDEQASGRTLLNMVAGSYVLGSVPRAVFVMQAASDDTTDNRVVWTCCKNNDGELGARSAWERRNGLFAPVTDFDWEAFDMPQQVDRVTITADDMAELFENGAKQLRRADAVKQLESLTGAKRTACYTAVKADGRFAKQLRESHGLLSWKE